MDFYSRFYVTVFPIPPPNLLNLTYKNLLYLSYSLKIKLVLLHKLFVYDNKFTLQIKNIFRIYLQLNVLLLNLK